MIKLQLISSSAAVPEAECICSKWSEAERPANGYCSLITRPDCAYAVCKLCLTTEARLQNHQPKRMNASFAKTGLRLNEHSFVSSTFQLTMSKSHSRVSVMNASWRSARLLDW